MGKGSKRRPSRISWEREELTYLFAQGKMTLREYAKRRAELIKKGEWNAK